MKIRLMCFLLAGAGLFLLSSTCFAQGACPASSPLKGNHCYFVAASGSDSNSGTSEALPWQHAPGMPNCSGVCGSVQRTFGGAGTAIGTVGIIFRGGDSWHFGDSSATPYTGGTWVWGWNGSSASQTVYIGVDPAWFSGTEWQRPILTADNPTSTKAVSSCAYKSGPSNQIANWASTSNVTLDNFEFTGLCQQDVGAPFAHDIYLVESADNQNLYEHLYFHGWTHTPWSCTSSTGECFNMMAILGAAPPSVDQNFQIVVDGSDSDPAGAMAMYGGGYNISQSVFRYVVGFVTSDLHAFHDNLLEYISSAQDGVAHSNLFESSGESANSNVIYGNIMRNICLSSMGCTNLTGIWLQPRVGNTDYFFNNVAYNAYNLEYFNVGQNSNSGDQGQMDIFNNIFENSTNGNILNWVCPQVYAHPFIAANNIYITNNGSAYQTSCSSANSSYVTELTMTHTAAANQGYTSAGTYAYTPPASVGYTVNGGTNESSTICGQLSASSDPLVQAAGTACAVDTRYSCVYDSTNHTIVCPGRKTVTRPAGGWAIGAYQSSETPNPPTSLTVTPH